MNKKLFGTLLLGSLLMGGTFVSCKDYDDDIDNLQEQINNLATKSDVETKLGQLQSALTAAQQKAEEALAAAKAADNSAEVKALSEKLDKIADAQAAVNEALEATKNEVSEQLAEFDEATKQMIADAQKKTEETIGKVADYVTSVEFVLSNNANPSQDFNLEFVTITEKNNVFGEGLPGAITFTKGTQVQRPSQTILVRVSPTNAELTADMISLVDSKGRNLNDLMDINVKRSDMLITRATNSSIWEITATLKNYDKDTFNAAADTKVNGVDKKILYAVQINNSLSVAESRYVTSTYDLALKTGTYTPQSELKYWIGGKKVTEVNNRFSTNSVSYTGNAAMPTEYKWINNTPQTTPIYQHTDPTQVNAETYTADNRDAQAVYALVQGQKLTIKLDQSTNMADVNAASAADIKALYVTLDSERARESEPSELNAWKGYTYTGLDKVVMGNEIEISVDAESAINDIIGFRVYAVNWDGTLVDPDGRAFYVKLGKEASAFEGLALVKTPISATDNAATSDKVTFAKQATAAKATFTAAKNDETGLKVTLAKADGTVIGAVTGDKTGTESANVTAWVTAFQTTDGLKDIKVTIEPTAALNQVIDDKTYTGTIKVYDGDGFLLYTVPVSYTKTLPQTTPNGFSVKTNQVVNGVYNCYLVPNTPSGATDGTMDMDQVFNWGEGTDAMYEITFAASKTVNNEVKDVVVTGNNALSVAKAFIDNTTAHATSVSYNYGQITSQKNDQGAYIDHVVSTGVQFNTVYNCVYNSQFSWAYATRAQLGGAYNTYVDPAHPEYGYAANPWNHELIYGTTSTVQVEEFIYGSTAIDSQYCGILKNLKASTYNQLTYKANSAKLITKANNQANEYFLVTVDGTGALVFTVDPDSSNPTADVECTLEMTYTDAYGHDVKVSVDVTVKKR